jgi:hypothetical protein
VSDAWRGELLDAYRHHRVDDQIDYYGAKATDFERARRWTVTITALLLVMAALFGALGAAYSDHRAMWAFFAATLSAVATAVSAFEAASGFERFSRQYAETRAALVLAAAHGPRTDDVGVNGDEAGGETEIQSFVVDVERVLRAEVDTWSHVAERPPGDSH